MNLLYKLHLRRGEAKANALPHPDYRSL